jgi:hypothetical protein
MAQAAAEQLSPAALARAHHAFHHRLGGLVERGRADGSFRADLPAPWLVTGALALIYACAQEVRAGRSVFHEITGVLAFVATIFAACVGYRFITKTRRLQPATRARGSRAARLRITLDPAAGESHREP